MNYYTASSHASRPCFFDRNHKIVSVPVDFDYNKESNPDGIYCQSAVEADSEFQAGIEFVKLRFPANSLAELMDWVIARCGDFDGEITRDVAELIEELNEFLPPGLQKQEGEHYEVE